METGAFRRLHRAVTFVGEHEVNVSPVKGSNTCPLAGEQRFPNLL